jgi:hypothetical protein
MAHKEKNMTGNKKYVLLMDMVGNEDMVTP